jgi:hypothetical protein
MFGAIGQPRDVERPVAVREAYLTRTVAVFEYADAPAAL